MSSPKFGPQFRPNDKKLSKKPIKSTSIFSNIEDINPLLFFSSLIVIWFMYETLYMNNTFYDTTYYFAVYLVAPLLSIIIMVIVLVLICAKMIIYSVSDYVKKFKQHGF